MGTDINAYAEIRAAGSWDLARNCIPDLGPHDDPDEVFHDRDYGLFGFLANVSNYSHVPVIAEPRGLPDNMSAGAHDKYADHYHSATWLTLAELLAYDYEQVFWDRRIMRDGNGAALAKEGEGRHLPLREFLGQRYFDRLAALATLADPADVRVILWFG